MENYKRILSYFVLIFIIRFSYVSAAYSYDKNACPYGGLNKRPCRGSGTSDVADFIGYYYNDAQDGIFVSSFKLYYVLGVRVNWIENVRLTITAATLYATALEIKGSYYVIEHSGCPVLKKLTDSKVFITGTEIYYKELLRVIHQTRQEYDIPCNVFEQSTLVGPVPRDTEFLQQPFQTLTSSNVITAKESKLKYDNQEHELKKTEDRTIRNKNWDVKTQCESDKHCDQVLLVQNGYDEGTPRLCKDTSRDPSVTTVLENIGVNTEAIRRGQRNSLCILATGIRQGLNTVKSPVVLFGYFYIFSRYHEYLLELRGYVSGIFFTLLDEYINNLC